MCRDTPSPCCAWSSSPCRGGIDFPSFPVIGRARTAGFPADHRPRQLVVEIGSILMSSLDGVDIFRLCSSGLSRVRQTLPQFCGAWQILPHGLKQTDCPYRVVRNSCWNFPAFADVGQGISNKE